MESNFLAILVLPPCGIFLLYIISILAAKIDVVNTIKPLHCIGLMVLYSFILSGSERDILHDLAEWIPFEKNVALSLSFRY